MAREKISITISEAALKEIEARSESSSDITIAGRSTIISRDLERYYESLKYERQMLRDKLSTAEVSLILDTLNGLLMSDPFTIRLLWANVHDAIGMDSLDKKWEVDGPALVRKLKGLDYISLCALTDACERWWNRVGQGEQPKFDECLA